MDFKEIEIPEDIKERSQELHQQLIDKVADADDSLMEKYLEDGVLEIDEIDTAIRIHTLAGKIFPILGGDARMGITKTILDAVVRFLPSPLQKTYVIEDKQTEEMKEFKGSVAGYHPDTGELVVFESNENAPFCGLIFKVVIDSHVGTLNYMRIYSGKLSAGSYVQNTSAGVRERVGRILLMHANMREEVNEVRAGDIVALIGLKESMTGQTLCNDSNKIMLESIDFPDPVVSLAVEPKTKSDQEKMGVALMKLSKEDPTFKVFTDKETGQTIISGMGELHLEIKVNLLEEDYGLLVNTGKPRVAYKETVEAEIEHREILKKQTGGAGQFADMTVIISPTVRGEGYKFLNEIKGGAIPTEFIPSVDKGIQQAMNSGPLGGYPVVDFQIRLTDGSYHEVDSNTDTFRICAQRAFKEAMKKAKPILLEPIMKVVVTSPDEFLGDITGALSSKRGIIRGMKARGKVQEITALVPLGNMFGWINNLRSMSKGKASSVMEFDSYQKVPENLVEEILNQ